MAEQYWMAADVLENQNADVFRLQMVMLQAISLEMFLKCLTALENRSYRDTHKLDVLISRLTPNTISRLRKITDEYIAPILQKYIEDAIPFLAPEQKIPKVDFDYIVSMSANAFVDWRYYYENTQPYRAWLAAGMIGVVRSFIVELRPEWSNLNRAVEVTINPTGAVLPRLPPTSPNR